MMRVVSINTGLPREVEWKGRKVLTAIFKTPVQGCVPLRKLNFDGDRQADLSVHGGVDKAVYLYSVEHYGYWRSELDASPPIGMFGENITTEGLLEDDVSVGDRLRAGTAELIVTQPRLPCFKLGLRFGRDDMVKRFLASRRTGFYAAVVQEGEVGAGDEIEWIRRDPDKVAISLITRLYLLKTLGGADLELLRRAVRIEALPESWRTHLLERIEHHEKG